MDVRYVIKLETRIRTWKKQFIEWVMTTILLNISLGFFGSYLLSVSISGLDWVSWGVILSLILFVPAIFYSFPRIPTQADVDFEIEFLTKCDMKVILVDE
ncbi:hypothetical protein VII00023_22804 [Vibrio ichthyoenteri ATCC 700023]|uniref:Uncharacterized protein n=1 Tax=Vibrio ichthyoenteri ATCC 700023 TaxID=870968 RepID=F9S7G6_9VIBR|nr:hypothetical protein [Vibrio ichthyoenteri]EGU31262.1 hypothetical protein VII00023_22804 [Vibrio ichthyoenteri ATCC 700023]